MSKLPDIERKPLSFGMTMLASALGIVIVSVVCGIIMFIFTIIMIASIASMGSNNDTIIKSNSFLNVDMSKIDGDRTDGTFHNLFGKNSSIGLIDAAEAVRKAADDPKIKGLYISNTMAGTMSWGSLKELRDAILDFKESGKPVISYSNAYSLGGYYISTTADMMCLHPNGIVEFGGMSGSPIYYKDLFDKMNLEMQLIRPESCAYKSAGETYTMSRMSDANRKQIRAYISSIWKNVTADIAKSRTSLTVARLNNIADNLSGYLAPDARSSLLVDSLCFEQDVKQMLKDNYAGKHLISIDKYSNDVKKCNNDANDKIAVIYAEGNVIDGTNSGMNRAVYGDDIVKAFKEAAEDDDVKAIVLRVNSPGGQVTASESMTHAIMQVKGKKPIIVSMGDLAASAGYEISCNADVIVAQPTTITGSIGVFATFPNIGRMLKNKLGITTDTVKTNRNSADITFMRPLSKEAKAMLNRNVEDFYKVFVGRVAKGRGLTEEHVHSIARGRVWTGSDALGIGLVDTLGGFDLALRIASEKANLTNYKVKEYPENDDPWKLLGKLFGDNDDDLNLLAKARLAWKYRMERKNIPDMISRIEEDLLYVSNTEGLQARIPFIICE